MTHDQLHSACHVWLWNEHPELRGLFHTNFSDIKIVEDMVRTLTGLQIGSKRSIILARLKSIGLVKGTYDHEFLYHGTIHFFDAKVGGDRLSPEQIHFKAINTEHGAKCYEYSTVEEFKKLITEILCK